MKKHDLFVVSAALAAVFLAHGAFAAYYHHTSSATSQYIDEPGFYNQNSVAPAGNIIEWQSWKPAPTAYLHSDLTSGYWDFMGFQGAIDLGAGNTVTLSPPGGYGAAMHIGYNGDWSPYFNSQVTLESGTLKGNKDLIFDNEPYNKNPNLWVVATGDDSVLDFPCYFFNNIRNCRVESRNGATVKGRFRLGAGAGASNSVIRVDGGNWIVPAVDAENFVGETGCSNRFEVVNGGRFENRMTGGNATAHFTLGYNAASKRNHLLVDNSTFINTNCDLVVGYNGGDNGVVISGGAKAKIRNFYVGQYSSGNGALVTGEGTEVTASFVRAGYAAGNNVFRLTDGAKLTTPQLTAGGESGGYGEIYIDSSATLCAGLRNLYVGYGGGSSGKMVIAGQDHVDVNGQWFAVGFYGSNGLLEITDGTELCHTNSAEYGYIGCFAGSTNNTFRITSGASFREKNNFYISKTSGADCNCLELDNGSFRAPQLLVEYGSDNSVVIKGTNSYLYSDYTVIKGSNTLRFEVPVEGYAASKATSPIANFGAFVQRPDKITVNVPKNCADGRWHLMTFDYGSSGDAAAMISRIELTGPGAQAAKLESARGYYSQWYDSVFLKVKQPKGMMLFVK